MCVRCVCVYVRCERVFGVRAFVRCVCVCMFMFGACARSVCVRAFGVCVHVQCVCVKTLHHDETEKQDKNDRDDYDGG